MIRKFSTAAIAAVTLFCTLCEAKDSPQALWQDVQDKEPHTTGSVILKPKRFRLVKLQNDAMQASLLSIASGAVSAVISLPTPEGSQMSVLVKANSLLPAGMQSKYPGIKTFSGTDVAGRGTSVKIDYTDHGFHAMVITSTGTYFIDPYSTASDGYYMVYKKSDYERNGNNLLECLNAVDEVLTPGEKTSLGSESMGLKVNGDTRKTYRLALSCTVEYAQAVDGPGATKSGVLSAMTTTMNRVNGIYEREVAVTFQFIDNMDTLIYLADTTDPFTGNFNGSVLLGENQINTDAVIGSEAYDIGHIFSTGGGGIAMLGSVCSDWGKARGVTGSPNPVGDPFDVDYVSHEIGHQFGADHTFNQCSGTEAASSAYEPGSGSTIMAYAGICGASNNLQANSHDYFHARSLTQMGDFLVLSTGWGGGASCGTALPGEAAVNLPIIDASYSIPYKTPFELTAPEAVAGGTGVVSYCWEQWDRGNFRTNEAIAATFTSGPSMRSFAPTETTVRTFPVMDSIVRNVVSYRGERLPELNRVMNFKLTAREISAEGWGTFNISDDEVVVNVINTGNPFKVLFPSDAGISLQRGSIHNITWDVASTDVSPISTAEVDIMLSVDGGYTYPITLATAIPNIGTATITIPSDLTTTTARLKVKGSGNIFFDISDRNFTVGDSTTLNAADIQLDENISVYPNPATNNLYVSSLSAQKNSVVKGLLYNAVGQKMWTENIEGKTMIDMSAMARGLYFLHLFDKNAQTIKKIIIQ